MDRQCLWTWELHRLQHLATSWWGNDYGRRLELHTLEVLLPSNANSKCGGDMWVSRVSSFRANSLSWIGVVLVLLSCSLKKYKKWEELPWWQCWTLHQQTIVRSMLNVLLLTLNKALPRGRPRIARYTLMLLSVWIKLNHASCFLYLPLYALVWMCGRKYILRLFKSSMVFGLKCRLQ